MFSCQYFQSFRDSFFYRTTPVADFELRVIIQKKHTGKVGPFTWDPRPGTRNSSPGTRDPYVGHGIQDPGPLRGTQDLGPSTWDPS